MIAMIWLPLLLSSLLLCPSRGDADLAYRIRLVQAVSADVTTTPHERRILMRIAWLEGGYLERVGDCRTTGDQGRAVGPWQHLDAPPEMRERICLDLAYAAVVARTDVRRSVAACRHLPAPERLAVFARGRCDSEEGRRLSRHRWSE